MIKMNFVQLREFYDARIKDPYAQKKLRSVSVGIAVGRQLPLPSSTLEPFEVKRHYNDSVNGIASGKIAEFNEQLVVDFEEALEIARAIWVLRYQAAFPSKYIPLLPGDDDIFVKMFEASAFISKDTHDFCNSNKTLLISSINQVTKVLYVDIAD